MKQQALATVCVLAAMLLSSHKQLASCFWLTDSSLFQSQLVEPAAAAKSQQPAPVKTTDFTDALLVSRPQSGVGEPWIRAEEPRQPAAAECQCNLTWLQNQTNAWLNQWLSAAQMRWTSSSTGAQQQQQQKRHSSHWSARNRSDTWLRKRNLGQPAPGARKLEPEQRQQQQQSAAERGPQGPKGESGARGERGPPGERGPSGLIGVRDQRALFDLESGAEPLLAFVESKQLLVLRTRLGWRPVPLLAPLRRPVKAPKEQSKRPQSAPDEAKGADGRKSPAQGASTSSSTRRAQSLEEDDDDAATFDEERDQEEDDDDDDDDDEDEDDGEEDDDDEELDKDDDGKLGRSKAQWRAANGQVSEKKLLGRSAAALVSASIENSPASLLAKQALGEHQKMTNGPKLRLAALNEPFSGNVHGIRGADFECKRNAARANLRGSFRAFLAAGFQNLNELVRHNNAHKYAVVNLRGETLASSWQDFFKQPARFSNPLSRVYSFDGRPIATDSNWPNKLVWHGATNKAGYRDLVSNCDGWHSDSLNRFGLATPIHSPKAYRERQQLREAAAKAQRRRINNRGLDNNLVQGENLAQFSNSDDETTNSAQNSSSSSSLTAAAELGHVFETIGKYPCRMPLIVLCIETVGQQLSSEQFKSDFEANNMGLL